MYDIIIIGAGPAGLTAAIYASRAMKSVLIIEKEGFGGQIVLSPGVENYPGVQGSINGADLANTLVEKAIEFGAITEFDEIVGIESIDGGFMCHGYYGHYAGKAVIIAAGAHHRKLGLESEERLTGRGVSYCAVCDGAFFKGKPVAVIGGGSTALADALLLSDLAKKVYLIHRRDEFRGEAHVVERLRKKENVEFVLNAVPEEFVGESKLEALKVKFKDGSERTLEVSGAFVAIGQTPSISEFKGMIELDESGYALSAEDCLTRTPGIFVAGDCRRKAVRQLTTATADGTVAALAACDYVDNL
ncbi:MAG: FAD-dependent oxidoreductase [Clostridia bacterium]|nr:FAD-dependent oxidoreductase [Clostridia bacterium]